MLRRLTARSLRLPFRLFSTSSEAQKLDAFQALLERGLGVSDQVHDMREPMASKLRTRGWFACDGLLGETHIATLRREVEGLHAAGHFSQSYSEVAETGERIWRENVEAMELKPDTWESAPTLVAYLAEMMRAVPANLNAFNDQLALSTTNFGHKLAVSTGAGAHYPKHLDNTIGAPHDMRKLTAILYLNPSWDDTNGGEIRIFDGADDSQPPTELLPHGDRLLLFWSDLLVHQVMPCYEQAAHGHRFTFTMWFASDNPLAIANRSDPLYALRERHYPSL